MAVRAQRSEPWREALRICVPCGSPALVSRRSKQVGGIWRSLGWKDVRAMTASSTSICWPRSSGPVGVVIRCMMAGW